MKKIILLLLIPIFCYSQKKTDTLKNFVLIDGNVIWIKKFNLKKYKDLQKKLFINEFTNNLKEKDSVFSGRSNTTINKIIDKKPEFATWGFDAFCVVEFSKGTYSVVIKDIIFRGPTQNFGSVLRKLDYSLNINIQKDNKFKTDNNSKVLLNKLDQFFINQFNTIK